MQQIVDERVKRELSMNVSMVRRLYAQVEHAIEDQIEIPTFLTLSIADKKQYEQVPDLLYALLVYIMGREEGDTIHISGITEE